MTLQEIEQQLRKNCIMAKGSTHPLHTDYDTYKSLELGMIIFVASCRVCGFGEKEVIHYLGVNKSKYFILLAKYIQAHNECSDWEIKELYDNITFNKTVIAKLKLILNAFKLQNINRQYIDLKYFGY